MASIRKTALFDEAESTLHDETVAATTRAAPLKTWSIHGSTSARAQPLTLTAPEKSAKTLPGMS